MDVRFIFPELTAQMYKDEIGNLNDNISDKNSQSFLPRFITNVAAAISFLLSFVVILFIWDQILFLVTGRGLGTVIVGIVLMIIAAAATFILFYRLLYIARNYFLNLIGVEAYEESFSLSKYTERKADGKLAFGTLAYYELIDRIKDSDISDCSVEYLNGESARVTIAYMDTVLKKRHMTKMVMPYRVKATIEYPTIDFDRAIVLLPAGTVQDNRRR